MKSLDFENRDIELIEKALPATINSRFLLILSATQNTGRVVEHIAGLPGKNSRYGQAAAKPSVF